MKEIRKLNWLHKLKEIERRTCVKDRFENPAEHTWSAQMLAAYFMPEGLDELKVYKLLLYHDLVEIEVGDVFAFDAEARKAQEAKEWGAYKKLCRELPGKLKLDFKEYWKEFEEGSSIEARFAKACDKLDPVIQTAFFKPHFKKMRISESAIRAAKDYHFEEFPEIKALFEKLMKHFKDNDFFAPE
jgi:putative hydrolases of HD superfamily